MPALNPFLRALFQSSVLGHALPSLNYVLLVPTTESLLYGQDRETGRKYADQIDDEDFLGSHILRILPAPAAADGTTTATIRDSRSKAKTYTTVNSRTIIIKDNMVYNNKGFKVLTQAQILNDALYHSPTADGQQWLVFYISKPLIGMYESTPVKPAIIGSKNTTRLEDSKDQAQSSSSSATAHLKKKDIKTFNELLNQFPMIARQMQPGLERLLNEFGKELGKPLPPPPSRTSTASSLDGSTQVSDSESVKSNGSIRLPFNSAEYFEDEEDLMRKALETAVTAAIDLFQGVDKQQLSLLGATTDLTGPAVEKLIERYVTESVHDSLLFPRLCSFYKRQDQHLDRRIRQTDCLDVSQVGIEIEDGHRGKSDLLDRIERGAQAFRKMGVAGSPQQMLEILLDTQKAVSQASSQCKEGEVSEKCAADLTINADILVSLLLLVVIRSQIRHLQARLSYMQHFIFIDDVESGEIGYSLSTLEAVLTYLARDGSGLRKASRQNKVLWDAVKAGNVQEIKAVFDGSSEAVVSAEAAEEQPTMPPLSRRTTANSEHSQAPSLNGPIPDLLSPDSNLAHVFPFQAPEVPQSTGKRKKRVHMDARSMSISSSVSILSKTATIETTLSGIEGDTSVQSLAQTQDPAGNSVLMMAVESQQPESLKYLLRLSDHYSIEAVMNDATTEGITLFSAAVQLANIDLVEVVLDFVVDNTETVTLRQYLSKTDSRGRSAAHYIFNTPKLISKLANMLPWRQKDKIGHTPLFAICRTYDHIDYSTMVSEALVAARNAQGDGKPLRLIDHTDIRGNTLLHIVNDPTIMHRMLHTCDVDPNAMNDKKFTPLMLASKYGRIDMVRIFFGDPRIDLHLREARGLTAVELAKDDEIRNRIDDLMLFANSTASESPAAAGRLTAVVRSFFVEDGSTRYVLKSGAPSSPEASTTYTITTSRRSIKDFEDLAKWLTMDYIASYMPRMNSSMFRSPFQLHSRPSRAVLHDSQIHLDHFLRILMDHPSFSMHEMLWEFLLVPEIANEQMAQRANMKAELRREKLAEEYEPLVSENDLEDVESVITHSREMMRRLNMTMRFILRHGHNLIQAHADLAESASLASNVIATLGPPSTTLPKSHVDAFTRAAQLMATDTTSSPLVNYVSALTAFQSTVNAVSLALARPTTLITRIRTTQRDIVRLSSSIASNSSPRRGLLNNLPINLNIPGSEESRTRHVRDAENKIVENELEVDRMGRELRFTNEVVVGELAGWMGWRESRGKAEVRKLANGMVVRERERLKGLERVLDSIRTLKIEADGVNGS